MPLTVLVCIPFGRDQPNNATYVVAKGAGLKLGKKASVISIREVIQRVVKEPAFREKARQLGKTLAEMLASQPEFMWLNMLRQP